MNWRVVFSGSAAITGEVMDHAEKLVDADDQISVRDAVHAAVVAE